jgi:hypothetical protein
MSQPNQQIAKLSQMKQPAPTGTAGVIFFVLRSDRLAYSDMPRGW